MTNKTDSIPSNTLSYFGLSREQIQKLADKTVKEHALHLVHALRVHDYDGVNLAALLEIFAGKLAGAAPETGEQRVTAAAVAFVAAKEGAGLGAGCYKEYGELFEAVRGYTPTEAAWVQGAVLKALAQPPGCGYPACGCADITQCEALKAGEQS